MSRLDCYICGEEIENGQGIVARATKPGQHPFAHAGGDENGPDGSEFCVAHRGCEDGFQSFAAKSRDVAEAEKELRRAFKGIRGRA